MILTNLKKQVTFLREQLGKIPEDNVFFKLVEKSLGTLGESDSTPRESLDGFLSLYVHVKSEKELSDAIENEKDILRKALQPIVEHYSVTTNKRGTAANGGSRRLQQGGWRIRAFLFSITAVTLAVAEQVRDLPPVMEALASVLSDPLAVSVLVGVGLAAAAVSTAIGPYLDGPIQRRPPVVLIHRGEMLSVPLEKRISA